MEKFKFNPGVGFYQLQDEVFIEIQKERRRQDEKWGFNNHSDEKWVCILSEEVGEVAKTLIEDGPAHLTDEEIIQVAAVCVAWLLHRKLGLNHKEAYAGLLKDRASFPDEG